MLFLCLGEFIASRGSNLPELFQIVVSFFTLLTVGLLDVLNVYFSIKTSFINLFVYVCAYDPINKEMLCSLVTCMQWPCASLTEAVISNEYTFIMCL